MKNDKLEVFQALAQAAANAGNYTDLKHTDGALHREKGDMWKEFTINDDFKVKFIDNKIIVTYQCQVQNSMTTKNFQFEAHEEERLADIVSYLKKEYKKISGKTIEFKKVGEIKRGVEQVSMARKTVTAVGVYELSGVESHTAEYQKDLDAHRKEQLKQEKIKEAKAFNFKESIRGISKVSQTRAYEKADLEREKLEKILK